MFVFQYGHKFCDLQMQSNKFGIYNHMHTHHNFSSSLNLV